ncbi:MAG: hypothetical protein ABJL99_18795 [Aliishimia sp.]
MADDFSTADWAQINAHLDGDPQSYGMPEHRDGSLVMMSWNIRKFGELRDRDGPKKTAGAFDMIVRVCAQADLIAIQEVMVNTESLYHLRDRLNALGDTWEVFYSDVTGEAPGTRGSPERMGYVYRTSKVTLGRMASDLSFDRTAVVGGTQDALHSVVTKTREKEGEEGMWAMIRSWVSGQQKLVGSKLKGFVQFIRTPHVAEFIVQGSDGSAYELYCVNAHLVSGKSKTERELEFLALLEWLMKDSDRTVVRGGKTYVLLADLNLDFASNLDKRRVAFEEHIKSINGAKKLTAQVNFPFLDGGFFTNSRKTQTYDHIAWVSDDDRLPQGHHNELAKTLGPDGFDYGMFDSVQLFTDAGPGAGTNGPDYARYEHDFSDHMPIWVRLPLPSATQHRFTTPPS